MIGIVVVAHGGLASAYVAAVEHVVGQQDGIQAVQIGAEYDKPAKEAEIRSAMDAVDTGHGVVVVTDLYGSSPSNLCIRACAGKSRRVIYGANLPMLVKLAKSRAKPVSQAVDAAILAGRKYLDSVPHGSDTLIP